MFNNRKNCGCPNKIKETIEQPKEPKITTPTETTNSTKDPITLNIKGNDALNTIECGKKILSITKVGNKVIVMYDDCSYTTAPIDVVAKEIFGIEALKCLAESVKKVETNLTGLEQRLTSLENKPDKDTIYDDTEVKRSIVEAKQELNVAINNVKLKLSDYVAKDDLVVVENLEGTQDLFKVYPLNK